MRITIDTDDNQLVKSTDDGERAISLYSKEAFELLSSMWIKVGWDQKYPYTFSWMGRPIIQLPEDMIRAQEVIYRLKPDVIVETGVAHGGSLVYYASLCEAMGHGRIVGVDIEIRPHNRAAIEAHELFHRITLVEGDSVSPDIIGLVKEQIEPDSRVLVFLDSCHTKAHVRAELEAYCELVSPGSYIVATDGLMELVHDTPRGEPHWKTDHPMAAAAEFVAEHPDFALEQPDWPFNESPLETNVTHWPGAWLRRAA